MKKGVRALGIAESFYKGTQKSIMVGVVQRGDLLVDGFGFKYATLGGMDATDRVIEMYEELNRADINYLILSGTVISWFNVVDLHEVHHRTRLPVISVTYNESEGLVKYFMKYFPLDWHYRLLKHFKNGERSRVRIKTGYSLFVRSVGISIKEATDVLNLFTIEGKYPEPIRLAKLIANRLVKVI